MSKVGNIIFDLDGTLWDSRSQIIKAWCKVVPDIRVDARQLSNLMGKSNDEFIVSIFPNYNRVEAQKLMKKCEVEEVRYLSKFGATLYDNVIPTIKELSKSYNLFIVSNCQDGYIESFLTYYKLSNYFLDVKCSGKTNKTKEENINSLMNEYGLKTSETCYIGDTQDDYNASLKNNILFIWCKYGFGYIPNYEICVRNPSEIPSLIRTLL